MASNGNGRPGVMVYFDILPCLERLTREEMGALFEAIMDYARFGELPDLDGACAIAFDFMRPRIDLDAEAYEAKKESNKRAAMIRWHGKPGTEDASASDAMHNMPNTNTNSNPNSNPNPDPDTKSDTETNCGCMADKPPKTTTTHPSREDVKRYCEKQGYAIDWEYFYDYYAGNGWKTGKNRITDWKAVLRNWARKEEKNHGHPEKNKFSCLGPIGTVL